MVSVTSCVRSTARIFDRKSVVSDLKTSRCKNRTRRCVVRRDVIYRKECQEQNTPGANGKPFVVLTLGHALVFGLSG